jgi:hypothetical protein
VATFEEAYQRFIYDVDRAFDEITESMQDIPRAEGSRHYTVAQRITELRCAAQRIDLASKKILEYYLR